MEFKDSRTFANLMAGYAGESQAHMKYSLYAQKARKEGYEQIAAIFDETAHNERAHANEWLKYIHNGELPATMQNLQDAQAGEHFEWSEMYKKFAEEAKAEGYPQIAASFELVAKVEKEHDERYNTLIENMKNQEIFKKPNQQIWICRNCGHIHVADEAPAVCPICKHPQAFFHIKCDNY